MLDIALAIGIGIAANLTTDIIRIPLKKIKFNKQILEKTLIDVIYKTIDEYGKLFPIDECNNEFAFYNSQSLIEELLRFRIFNYYDQKKIIKSLEEAFKKNPNIIPPSKDELINFYHIFDKYMSKKRETLKILEIRTNFQNDLLYICDNFDVIKADLKILKSKVDAIGSFYSFQNNKIVYNPDYFLKAYNQAKIEVIESEDWPYAIDRKIFVKNFNFLTGNINKRENHCIDKYCIPFLLESLADKSMFCVAYYGMGKTTIAKFLFIELIKKKKYPVFLKLTMRHLNNYINNNLLLDNIFTEIATTLHKADSPYKVIDYSSLLLKNQFKNDILKLIYSKKIIIIFDGIDETINSPNSLNLFAEYLTDKRIRFFLTCRLEFYKFFSEFKTFNNINNNTLELCVWQKEQWQVYLNALYKKYEKNIEKINLISNFRKDIFNESFKDLPERPLFFKMLSDLFIDNKTPITIEDELKGNLAKIYYEFIHWKIKDDYERKRSQYGESNKEDALPIDEYFINFTFCLFKELAIREYKKTVPEKGAIAYIEENTSNSIKIDTGISTQDIKQCIESIPKIDYDINLEDRTIISIFINSTLFATIARKENKNFSFSHKSLLEYFVAYDLVDSIFHGDEENAYCNENWNIYQTYEVSDHLQSEIIRKCFYKFQNTTNHELLKKNFIRSAFEKVLNPDVKYKEYNERIEEVLYYIGKYKIESNSIITILRKIATGEIIASKIYLRTASISLSLLGYQEYILKYVLLLLENYFNDQIYFKMNKAIEINYYGESNIRKRLGPYLRMYLENAQTGNNILLRIYSYFTSEPIKSVDEYNQLIQTLESLIKKSESYNNLEYKKVFIQIENILTAEFATL